MKKYIEKRIEELIIEKNETLQEYAIASVKDKDMLDVLAERNVRISFELNFLNKYKHFTSTDAEPCKEVRCWNEAINEGYCRQCFSSI